MGKWKVAGAGLVAGLTACSGGEANESLNAANVIAEEGDLNLAISGDELSPIPEAEDDAAANLANQADSANAAGNRAGLGVPR